jgi:ribonuclease R
LVHITELGGEYFRFDEARQELRGERTGIRYAIGTRVRVQVSRVDLDGRKIDFRLVHDGEALNVRALRDKGAPPAAGGGSEGIAKSPAKRTGRKPSGDERSQRTPIQSLKSAVKKASASKSGGAKARKPRR